MKKLLLTLMLLPALAGAATKWVKVGSVAGSTVYIDKSSAMKSDKGHKVWSLTSYDKEQQAPDGKSYQSVKALHLYVCAERSTTLLSQVFYPEPMGKGVPTQTFKYEKFGPEDVVPDSGADAALLAVCRGAK